jgi:hypothetical protein
MTDKGRLLLGAKPLARYVFDDENEWRSLNSEAMRKTLGLFRLAGRVAGYTGVIDARLNAKVAAALAGAERESVTG